MPATDPSLRDRVAARLDEYKDRLLELSHRLHDDPETSFGETRAAERLAVLLEDAGFAVHRAVCGLPTARGRAGRARPHPAPLRPLPGVRRRRTGDRRTRTPADGHVAAVARPVRGIQTARDRGPAGVLLPHRARRRGNRHPGEPIRAAPHLRRNGVESDRAPDGLPRANRRAGPGPRPRPLPHSHRSRAHGDHGPAATTADAPGRSKATTSYRALVTLSNALVPSRHPSMSLPQRGDEA